MDTRLQAGLRVALTGYEDRASVAANGAERLAKTRAFQVALERRDRSAVAALLPPGLTVVGPHFRVGRAPSLAIRREADVITTHGLAGTVIASVPLNTSFILSLRSAAGLETSDRLALVDGTRIVAAAPTLHGVLALTPGRVAVVSVGGAQYRALAAPSLPDSPDLRFAVLTPQSTIDSAEASSRDRLLLGLLGAVLLVAAVAFLEGRSIVRALRGFADAAHAIAQGRLDERVAVHGRDEFADLGAAFNEMADQLESRLAELDAERTRLRLAIDRFGDALGATDTEQLLRVVVDTAVEATGAEYAELRTDGNVATAGNPHAEGETLEYALTVGRQTFGTLALRGTFDDEDRITAASLLSQASFALESARLHAIVEEQALVDGVTGIANRRQCEDALAQEISRADRLGAPFTLVVADLDDFKAVNDRHGHALGDDVLREFATILRLTAREADLAGRWGGEEFVLLLPGTDADGGVQLAERVRASLAERSFHGRDGAAFGVTCSFGVAQLQPNDGERALFAAADRALYEAKRLGKNRVERSTRIRTF
ncbi:MAG: diguanylate cyclase [Actinobacteria bacterium]|nr:diguanylate cyclase [Actinomycetota bacterium]